MSSLEDAATAVIQQAAAIDVVSYSFAVTNGGTLPLTGAVLTALVTGLAAATLAGLAMLAVVEVRRRAGVG